MSESEFIILLTRWKWDKNTQSKCKEAYHAIGISDARHHPGRRWLVFANEIELTSMKLQDYIYISGLFYHLVGLNWLVLAVGEKLTNNVKIEFVFRPRIE